MNPSLELPEECLACGSSEFAVPYPEVKDYITADMFSVISCRQCGLGFTSPTPENLNRFYPASYRKYNKWVASCLGFLYRRRVRDWNRMFQSPGSVLDIGCGDGSMLCEFQRLGWKVYGTERTSEMAQVARSRGVNILPEVPENLESGSQYDLIILFHVLEHMSNPRQILRTCQPLLKPNGKLIIGVPNFASWQAHFARGRWFHLDAPRHLFHFTQTALREMLSSEGFNLTSLSFLSIEHDPYGWLQSILNVYVNDRNRLTRLLIGFDPPRARDFYYVAALPFVAVPILLLFAVSLWARAGAILTVRAEGNGNVLFPSPKAN